MVQPGAQTKAPAPVLAEGAAWCETEVAWRRGCPFWFGFSFLLLPRCDD